MASVAAQTTWREMIDRAGGAKNAMLYGPALVELVAEVTRLREELELMTSLRAAAVVAATQENERIQALQELLRQHRDAAATKLARLETVERRLVYAEAVVSAARRERDLWKIGPQLALALNAIDASEAVR